MTTVWMREYATGQNQKRHIGRRFNPDYQWFNCRVVVNQMHQQGISEETNADDED